MDESQLKQRLISLREQIRKHNYQYYVLNDPLISDYEWDRLMNELKQIEAEHPTRIKIAWWTFWILLCCV